MKIDTILIEQAANSQLDLYLETPSHALLLSGPKGGGKTHVATSLAGSLLSASAPSQHAYFRAVQPTTTGAISIAQIRELINFFRLKVPGTSRIRRVAIIEDSELMGTDAQNALLKLLEEPPVDSAIILTSSRPQALLPTIRSRLQHIRLSAPSVPDLTTFFVSQGYDEMTVSMALLRAGTNIAEVTHILNEGAMQSGASIELAKKVLTGNSYDRLLIVDKLSKQKDAAIDFVEALAIIAMASLQSAAAKGANTIDRWQKILQAVDVAQEALARSGNPKLVLTELMLTI